RIDSTIRTRINSGVYRQTSPTSIPTTSTPSTSQAPSVHLPKLELSIFSGKPFAWFELWDIFEATVDRHPHLSPVEKLIYLISCLRGEAKESVSGYQLIDANYQPVINTLRTLYGDEDEVGRFLQVELRHLPTPAHNSRGLLHYYNESSRILNHMQLAGLDVENAHVLFDLEDHLPETTKRYIYMEKLRTPNWTTDLFKSTLLAEIRIRFQTVEQRQQRTEELGICPKCFKKGHAQRDCRGPPCLICKKSTQQSTLSAKCTTNSSNSKCCRHCCTLC
ncbi:unnamed protein product, partial [Toxocara canis]|uniref:CCHC-type domain-containing protein n=1 Tax=Toxocara canis TaxID=6265 RepID=A0A183U4N1_TOXCA